MVVEAFSKESVNMPKEVDKHHYCSFFNAVWWNSGSQNTDGRVEGACSSTVRQKTFSSFKVRKKDGSNVQCPKRENSQATTSFSSDPSSKLFPGPEMGEQTWIWVGLSKGPHLSSPSHWPDFSLVMAKFWLKRIQFKVLRKAIESQIEGGGRGWREKGLAGEDVHNFWQTAFQTRSTFSVQWIALQLSGVALRSQDCGQVLVIHLSSLFSFKSASPTWLWGHPAHYRQ